MLRSFVLASSLLAGLVPNLPASARDGAVRSDPSYTTVHRTPLGSPDRWDYVLFDPSGGRVFVAHGDRADVVDGASGSLLGRVAPLDGAHGIAVAPEFGLGFADSGEQGTLTAFDLGTLKPVATLPAGKDADAVVYDTFSKRVFVMNGDAGTITVIDAKGLTPVGTIQMGGKLEFAAADGHGALFVNLADAGAVARLDTATDAVTARWPVPDCLSPHGMAYDDTARRIFTSCIDGRLKVLDAEDGRVVATLPIGKGSDSVALDTRRQRVFSANSSGSLSIIAMRGADHFVVQPPLAIPPGTRTMAVDPVSGRIYLASATANGRVASPAPGRAPRYGFAPGSLSVLMLEPR